MPKPAPICVSVSCRRKVGQADESTLVRRELAAAVTLTGDDEHGYPLDQGVREVECGRIGNQRGSCANAAKLEGSCPCQVGRRYWWLSRTKHGTPGSQE